MQLLQHQTIIKATALLTLLLRQIIRCEPRFIDISLENEEMMTPIYEGDQIMMKKHVIDKQGSVENNEENEVISVRLLNSYQLTPFVTMSAEVPDLSYENVQEPPENSTNQKVINEWNITMTSYEKIKATMISSTNNTSTTTLQSIADDSLEHDWVYSRIEIPESPEETTSFITTDSQARKTTERPAPKSTTVPVNTRGTTTKQPIHSTEVIATRKRTARNENSYHSRQSDLNNINLSDLDYSEMIDEIIRGELLSSDTAAESTEQSYEDTNQLTPEQQNLNGKCTCAKQHQKSKEINCGQYTTPEHIFRRTKRLHNKNNHVEDDSSSPDLSIERTERMQGAIERIMGLVTIMSHVDSFIQKKAKQSIRRLARLYESNENI